MDTQKKSLFSELRRKIFNFQISKCFSPEKCLVYLQLPLIGSVSLKYEKQKNQQSTIASARIVFKVKKQKIKVNVFHTGMCSSKNLLIIQTAVLTCKQFIFYSTSFEG